MVAAFLASYPLAQAHAGLPQPMVVYYGQAKDGFGWPYMEHATVFLLSGTNEIARHDIDGSLYPGVNFALYVPVDDGRETNRYVRNAVVTGEVVSIVIDDAYGRKTIMESNAVPAVTRPGDFILVNVTAGSDTDGDGLPDEWEQTLVDWSDGALTSIWDVLGADDFDNDGQSNEEEYRAGTFAFLDYDYFFAEQFERTPNGRICITFLSVPGKAYRIEGASMTLSDGSYDWRPCEYSLTETGETQTGPVEGTGDWLSFYVPLTSSNTVLRMIVE